MDEDLTLTPPLPRGAPSAPTSATASRAERRSRVVRIPRLPTVRPQRFIIPVCIALLVWLLVVELLGLHDIAHVLSGTDWLWVLGAFVLALVAVLTQAVTLSGCVTTTVPFGVLVRANAAAAFSGLIGGPTAKLATAVAVLRRRGLTPADSYSSGLIEAVAGVVVPLVLGLVFLPVAAGELRLSVAGPSGSNAATLQVLLAVVVATGLLGGLAFVVPRVRHGLASRPRPQFSGAWSNFYEVTGRPALVGRLLAGSALTQLVLAGALGMCAHAVGASVNFGALVLVCCSASVLGGIIPVPGGMGVVEAATMLGLSLVGLPLDLAAIATLLFRCCTAYLPPVWGYYVFARLREDHGG